MERLVRLLHQEQCSCVILSKGELYKGNKRGVADLYRLLHEEPALLSGAWIADKVVGKAAAALMIQGGVKYVHADTMSRHALELFKQTDIRVEYDTLTDHIINRAGTGWCPLETRCCELKSPAECLAEIEAFMNEIKNSKKD